MSKILFHNAEKSIDSRSCNESAGWSRLGTHFEKDTISRQKWYFVLVERELFLWNGIKDIIYFLPNQSSVVYIIIWGVQTRGFLVCWTSIRNTGNPWELSARVTEIGYYGTYSWTIPRITMLRIVLSTAWPVVWQDQLNGSQIDDVIAKMRIGSAIGTLVI